MPTTARIWGLLAVVFALSACGAGTTPLDADGGADADSPDADLDDDAGEDACPPSLAGLEDQPCEQEGTVCGGPCTDPCSFCNLLGCFDGRWQWLEAYPMPCFACGELQCVQPEQYCRIVRSDVVGLPDEYDCIDLPAGCEEPSCACLADSVVFDACTDDFGEVTVELFGG